MRRRWLFLRQRLRRENWRVLGLLLATLAILVLGVSNAVSGLEFGLLWLPTLLGLVLGWGLAASSVSGGVAAILSLLIGPVLIMIQIGNLLGPMAALANSLLATTPLSNAGDELTRATTALVTRLYDWFLALTRGAPVFDPVATAVLWLLVLWGAAVWAAWFVRRRNQPKGTFLRRSDRSISPLTWLSAPRPPSAAPRATPGRNRRSRP